MTSNQVKKQAEKTRAEHQRIAKAESPRTTSLNGPGLWFRNYPPRWSYDGKLWFVEAVVGEEDNYLRAWSQNAGTVYFSKSKWYALVSSAESNPVARLMQEAEAAKKQALSMANTVVPVPAAPVAAAAQRFMVLTAFERMRQEIDLYYCWPIYATLDEMKRNL